MPTIELRGVRIAYDDIGSGPPLVLSHAGISDRRMWQHQVRRFSAANRVITYDWRGYGESGDAMGRFAHYEDLLALMDALDVDRATLVGCSMGGAYSLDAALAEPERVAGLVLISSGLSGHSWPAAMLAAVRERVHASVPAQRLERYRLGGAERILAEDVLAMAQAQARFLVAGPQRDPADVDPGVWRAAITMLTGVFERQRSGPVSEETFLQPPAATRLSEVRVPALVLNGLADAPWIQDVSDLLVAGIPDAERLDLADTGHLAPLERSAEVNTALERFATRVAW